MNLRFTIVKVLSRLLLSKHDRLGQNSLISMLEKSLKSTKINVNTLFEIGANHGQDAKKLSQFYGLKSKDVYLFEPHPYLVEELNKKTDFNVFAVALSNTRGKQDFNITPINSKNDGVSTLGDRLLVKGNENYQSVSVEVNTLDNVVKDLTHLRNIDLVKIDVEGFTYEVLEGGRETFSNRVACVQLESETEEVFRGQKLYPEIYQLLKEFGFVEMYKEQHVTQNDTVWVHKRYLKSPLDFYTQKHNVR